MLVLHEAVFARKLRNKVVTRNFYPSLCEIARGRFFVFRRDILEPIIEIKSLTKTFGSGENQVEALRDVNISVESGEIFGIIGLSGAG